MALRNLPESSLYETVRKQIHQDISNTKSQIIAAKPARLRLESCRQALKRAEDRCIQADQGLKAAVVVKDAATLEVQRLRKDAAAIEHELNSARGSNSLAFLQNGMTKVLAEMAGSAAVPQDTVQQARAQMEQLFTARSTLASPCQQQGVQELAAEHAQQQALAAAQFGQQQLLQQQQAGGPYRTSLRPPKWFHHHQCRSPQL